ncbi:MAG: ABC transporter ATP-binding protein [Haloarculaceae archaeon]
MLELAGVEKAYDGFAFGPVDLCVDAEVLAVLGPSGSGKTTLLSLVAGLVSPDRGSVTLGGRSLVGRPLAERRVGLVFQDGALFPHMTARENVAYAADDDDRVAELAATLEIERVLDRRPGSLSGGERRRVALARTLAADPDALLLDEPLTSLDVPVRRRLRTELADLFADLAVPVVYVTHDQRAATALGDRVAVLRDGAIEQVGTPADVLRRPATPFVAEFTGSDNVFEATVTTSGDAGAGTGAGEEGVCLRVGDLTLDVSADAPAGATVTACLRPSRLRVDAPAAPADGGQNVVSGTVGRWANEGDEYRLVVAVDGADLDLVASVRPGRFEALSLAAGTDVSLAVPADHVHLITRVSTST